jgi:hypothetical protein
VTGPGVTASIAGQPNYFYVTAVDQWNNPTTLIEDISGNVLTQYSTDPDSMCSYVSVTFFYGDFDGDQTSPTSVLPTGNLAECLVSYTLSTTGNYLNYINQQFSTDQTLGLTVMPGTVAN